MLRIITLIAFILPKITVWPLVYFWRRRKKVRDLQSSPAFFCEDTVNQEKEEGQINN